MDLTDLRISLNTYGTNSVSITDISSWATNQREQFAMVAFAYIDSAYKYVNDKALFANWVIELNSDSEAAIHVFAVPLWSDASTYKAGDIVYSLKPDSYGPYAEYTFFKALGATTDELPRDTPGSWEELSETPATAFAAFDALSNVGDYDSGHATAYHKLENLFGTITKTSCNNYTITTNKVVGTLYSVYTLEEYINQGTPFINNVTFEGESFDFEVPDDGIYIIHILSGTNIMMEFMVIEICKLTVCYKKVLMDVLCSRCGCNEQPCTDSEVALDRKKRDFLNVYMSGFLALLALTNQSYSKSLGLDVVLVESEALSQADFLMKQLIEIKDNCNLCE